MNDKAKLIVKYGTHTAMVALTKAWVDTKASPLAMVMAEAKDFAKLNDGLAKSHGQWVEGIKLFEVDILDSTLFDAMVKAGVKSGNASEATLKRYVRMAKAMVVAYLTGSKATTVKGLEQAGLTALDTGNDGKPVKGYTAGNRKRAKADADKAKADADKAKAEAKVLADKADADAGITRKSHVLNITAMLALKVEAEAMLKDSKASATATALAANVVSFCNDVLTPVDTK